jgi:hypothetical protein
VGAVQILPSDGTGDLCFTEDLYLSTGKLIPVTTIEPIEGINDIISAWNYNPNTGRSNINVVGLNLNQYTTPFLVWWYLDTTLNLLTFNVLKSPLYNDPAQNKALIQIRTVGAGNLTWIVQDDPPGSLYQAGTLDFQDYYTPQSDSSTWNASVIFYWPAGNTDGFSIGVNATGFNYLPFQDTSHG